jgi:hypothetical protein
MGRVCPATVILERSSLPRGRWGAETAFGEPGRQAQGNPERQPVWCDAVAYEPAQVGRLDQGGLCRQPSGPRFRRASNAPRRQATRPGGRQRDRTGRHCRPRPSASGEETAVSQASALGPGRQFVWFFFDRTRQEPEIVVGCPIDLFNSRESIVNSSYKIVP